MIPAATISFLQLYFDKIFVVSLPRFTGRQQQIEVRLQGLNFDFFWGADKLQMDDDDVRSNGTYDEQRAKILNWEAWGKSFCTIAELIYKK